jgi:DNA repair protein RadD
MGDYALEELSKRVENQDKTSKQVAEALNKSIDRKAIIWVCTTIAHAELVAQELSNRGEYVNIIHSLNSSNDIIKRKEEFERGIVRHLVSVSMLSVGIDIPKIDCVVLLRPTKSSSLYVQICGRALRLYPEKKDALILDFGRCAENNGTLDCPNIRRGGHRITPIQTSPPMKFCPSCLSYISAALKQCPDCGYVYPAIAPNLTATAGTAAVLSEEIEPQIIEVLPIVRIEAYRKKVDCFKITFRPKNIFQKDILEWCFEFNLKIR